MDRELVSLVAVYGVLLDLFLPFKLNVMYLLKRIPIHYKGELHDVRLINFSVAMEELKDKVPASIKIRSINGRAMISMVDVKLKNMRPVLAPFARFNYRHIAFR